MCRHRVTDRSSKWGAKRHQEEKKNLSIFSNFSSRDTYYLYLSREKKLLNYVLEVDKGGIHKPWCRNEEEREQVQCDGEMCVLFGDYSALGITVLWEYLIFLLLLIDYKSNGF